MPSVVGSLAISAALIGSTALAIPAVAQTQTCHVLCAPTFTFMPGVVTTNLGWSPRVRSLSTGAVTRLPSKTNLELIGSLVIPTQLPRASLFVSVEWLPTAKTAENPFTLYTAHEVGDTVRADRPSVNLGATFGVLTPKETKGWFALNANISDLFSAAARPLDQASYTHKLDFDLVGTLNPFRRVAENSYLHGVGMYAILDYVATGLPHAGDVVPAGERVFLSSAHPLTLITGLSLPIAPLIKASK